MWRRPFEERKEENASAATISETEAEKTSNIGAVLGRRKRFRKLAIDKRKGPPKRHGPGPNLEFEVRAAVRERARGIPWMKSKAPARDPPSQRKMFTG